MLSSEYATYLSGRCVEIKMLPLSFSEFLTFHDFEIRETKSALGGTRKQAFDKTGEHYELQALTLFRPMWMRYWKHTSSMPSRDLILKERNSYVLLESITSLISDLETICLDSGIVIADMQ